MCDNNGKKKKSRNSVETVQRERESITNIVVFYLYYILAINK